MTLIGAIPREPTTTGSCSPPLLHGIRCKPPSRRIYVSRDADPSENERTYCCLSAAVRAETSGREACTANQESGRATATHH